MADTVMEDSALDMVMAGKSLEATGLAAKGMEGSALATDTAGKSLAGTDTVD